MRTRSVAGCQLIQDSAKFIKESWSAILHPFLREDVVKKNKISCSGLSSGVRCADVAETIRGAVRVIGNLLASGRALRLSVSKCEQHVKAGVQGSRFACCSCA